MITEKEYELALIVVREYQNNIEQLKNKDRLTIEEFISKIPRIQGFKDGTIRLIHNMEWLNFVQKENPHWLNGDIRVYIDEITEKYFMRIHNAGIKSWNLFCEYRNKYTL